MAQSCFRFDLIRTRALLMIGLTTPSKTSAELQRELKKVEGIETIQIFHNVYCERNENDRRYHWFVLLELEQPLSPSNLAKLEKGKGKRKCYYVPSLDADSLQDRLDEARLPHSFEATMFETAVQGLWNEQGSKLARTLRAFIVQGNKSSQLTDKLTQCSIKRIMKKHYGSEMSKIESIQSSLTREHTEDGSVVVSLGTITFVSTEAALSVLEEESRKNYFTTVLGTLRVHFGLCPSLDALSDVKELADRSSNSKNRPSHWDQLEAKPFSQNFTSGGANKVVLVELLSRSGLKLKFELEFFCRQFKNIVGVDVLPVDRLDVSENLSWIACISCQSKEDAADLKKIIEHELGLQALLSTFDEETSFPDFVQNYSDFTREPCLPKQTTKQSLIITKDDNAALGYDYRVESDLMKKFTRSIQAMTTFSFHEDDPNLHLCVTYSSSAMAKKAQTQMFQVLREKGVADDYRVWLLHDIVANSEKRIQRLREDVAIDETSKVVAVFGVFNQAGQDSSTTAFLHQVDRCLSITDDVIVKDSKVVWSPALGPSKEKKVISQSIILLELETPKLAATARELLLGKVYNNHAVFPVLVPDSIMEDRELVLELNPRIFAQDSWRPRRLVEVDCSETMNKYLDKVRQRSNPALVLTRPSEKTMTKRVVLAFHSDEDEEQIKSEMEYHLRTFDNVGVVGSVELEPIRSALCPQALWIVSVHFHSAVDVKAVADHLADRTDKEFKHPVRRLNSSSNEKMIREVQKRAVVVNLTEDMEEQGVTAMKAFLNLIDFIETFASVDKKFSYPVPENSTAVITLATKEDMELVVSSYPQKYKLFMDDVGQTFECCKQSQERLQSSKRLVVLSHQPYTDKIAVWKSVKLLKDVIDIGAQFQVKKSADKDRWAIVASFDSRDNAQKACDAINAKRRLENEVDVVAIFVPDDVSVDSSEVTDYLPKWGVNACFSQGLLDQDRLTGILVTFNLPLAWSSPSYATNIAKCLTDIQVVIATVKRVMLFLPIVGNPQASGVKIFCVNSEATMEAKKSLEKEISSMVWAVNDLSNVIKVETFEEEQDLDGGEELTLDADMTLQQNMPPDDHELVKQDFESLQLDLKNKWIRATCDIVKRRLQNMTDKDKARFHQDIIAAYVAASLQKFERVASVLSGERIAVLLSVGHFQAASKEIHEAVEELKVEKLCPSFLVRAAQTYLFDCSIPQAIMICQAALHKFPTHGRLQNLKAYFDYQHPELVSNVREHGMSLTDSENYEEFMNNIMLPGLMIADNECRASDRKKARREFNHFVRKGFMRNYAGSNFNSSLKNKNLQINDEDQRPNRRTSLTTSDLLLHLEKAVDRLEDGLYDQASRDFQTCIEMATDDQDLSILRYAEVVTLLRTKDYHNLKKAADLMEQMRCIMKNDACWSNNHYMMAKAQFQAATNNDVTDSPDLTIDHPLEEQAGGRSHVAIIVGNVFPELTNPKYLLDKLKNESRRLNQLPHVVCRHQQCQELHEKSDKSKLIGWQRNIRESDFGYKGFYRLTCADKCNIDFHPWCWKSKKEQDGIALDKDYLSQWCPTPDCYAPIAKVHIVKNDSTTTLEDKDLTAEMIQVQKDKENTSKQDNTASEDEDDVDGAQAIQDCDHVAELQACQDEIKRLREELEASRVNERERLIYEENLIKRNSNHKVHIEELKKALEDAKKNHKREKESMEREIASLKETIGCRNMAMIRVACDGTRQLQSLIKGLHEQAFPLSKILPQWTDDLEAQIQAARKLKKTDAQVFAKLVKSQPRLDVKAFLQEIENNKQIEEEEKKGPDSCTICLDEMLDEEDVETLECKHKFHKGCINNWARNQRTCPNCRKFTVPEDHFPRLGS